MSSNKKPKKSKPKYEEQQDYYCIECEEYIDLFDGGATYYETDDEYICEDCVIDLTQEEAQDEEEDVGQED